MLLLIAHLALTGFIDDQLTFPRVRQLEARVDKALTARLREGGFSLPPKIFFRAFKKEKTFELWVEKGKKLVLFDTLAVCASSGRLGPKVERGDGQVPEGLYAISHFNPTSNYHVSLKVDYPNAVDRVRSAEIFGRKPSEGELGGDIFVHGDCVTIGCLPLTDEKIEIVYWLAVLARQGGQRIIPIHIFPTTDPKAEAPDARTQNLWDDLAKVRARFESTQLLPKVDLRNGRYVLRE